MNTQTKQKSGARILGAVIILSVLLLTFLQRSFAAVPGMLSYHGILKDTAGNYLNGNYSITFRIYDSLTGGNLLWSETQNSVSLSSGRFSVQLGQANPLNLLFDKDYWVAVQIGADALMKPRQRLTSVGYAFMAERVANAFTQAQHENLSHMNVSGVKSAHTNIAKTNFKIDAFMKASGNNLGDLVIDGFNDVLGIDKTNSSGYEWRGTPNFDLIVQSETSFLNQDSPQSSFELFSNNGILKYSQSFSIKDPRSLKHVELYLRRLGNPQGTLLVRLYLDASGAPGNLISSTAEINPSLLSIYPDWGWMRFTFQNPPQLLANTTYHLVFEYGTRTFADGSNYVGININEGNLYAAGLANRYRNSQWVNDLAGSDLVFRMFQPSATQGVVQSALPPKNQTV